MYFGRCRAEAKPGSVKLVLTKAKSGTWGAVGELCSAESAGLGVEAAQVEAHRVAEPEELEDPGEDPCEPGAVSVPKPKAQAFYPASCYEGSRKGYVFQMGADGLGYYKDIDPMSKMLPAGAQREAVPEEEEEEEEPQTKWDWVQEARQGGTSKPLQNKGPKPAFKRGFIDQAAPKKAEHPAEEMVKDSDGFVMPGLDGDSDTEEEDEVQAVVSQPIDVAWTPSVSLGTQAMILELD